MHIKNIEVWATVRDFDGGINSQKESYELLSHTSRREKLINQLVAAALQTGIDGINVDFEKISKECGEHYIQFIEIYKKDYENWKKKAKEFMDAIRNEKKTYEEFDNWLDENK